MRAVTAQDEARDTCAKLLDYCAGNDWSGYHPYDALNSRIFTALPFLNARVPRLIATQALKRSPVNIRPLMFIPPTQNPKAIGLFLSAALKLRPIHHSAEPLPQSLIARLAALRSPDTDQWCWGYSFPWQTRTSIVPRGTPNLVCTTFAASALLDAYDALGDRRLLDMAASAASFIVNSLYRDEGTVAGFTYPLPSMSITVHNANLLGAALLCRVSRLTGNTALLEPALKAARYSAARQRSDGSWVYGEADTQQWIDNFHTGYNLCALQDIDRFLGTDEFSGSIDRGLRFYRDHFFLEDGTPKYFHDRTYPIDIHCSAQSIITLLAFRDRGDGLDALATRVLRWTLDHMWDERGFFYYRVLRFGTIRTSYMRWSQAWMLLALATYLTQASESYVDAA
jgi:hypothetical protein